MSDAAKNFSKKELVSILEIIEAANDCVGEANLRRILMTAEEFLGADYCICGLGEMEAGKPTKILTIVNGNYPQEWLKMYEGEKFHENDPVIKYHAKFSMTQFWSDSFEFYNDEASREVVRLAGDFGLRQGISSGIFEPELKSTSIFSFASRSDGFDDHHKKILNTIVVHMHKALVEMFKVSRANEARFFPGQKISLV